MKSFLKYLLRLIALACVVLIALACWEAKLVPRLLFGELYRVSVRMQLPPPAPRLLIDVADELYYITSREDQIRHDIILDLALKQPGIARLECFEGVKNQKAWLRDQLEIGYVDSNLDILEIAMTGNNPDELGKLLEAVRLAYLDRAVAPEREREMRRWMNLEKVYKDTEKKLIKKREEFKELSNHDPETAEMTARREELDRMYKMYSQMGEQLEEWVLQWHSPSRRGVPVTPVVVKIR